jgi:hypothetical protein
MINYSTYSRGITEYKWSPRVSVPSSELGPPHPFPHKREACMSSPLDPKWEEQHSLGVRRWGTQFGRLERKPGALYTLWYSLTFSAREYWMLCRGPARLSCGLWLGSELPYIPLPHQQLVSLSQSSCVSPVELTDGRGGRGWARGVESYDRKKAWASINHSIFSGQQRNNKVQSPNS